MFHRIHTETVNVRLANPIRVCFDKCVDHLRPDRVIVIGVVLEADDVAMLVLGRAIEIAYFAAAVIPSFVAEFDRKGPISAAKAAERKGEVVEVEESEA